MKPTAMSVSKCENHYLREEQQQLSENALIWQERTRQHYKADLEEDVQFAVNFHLKDRINTPITPTYTRIYNQILNSIVSDLATANTDIQIDDIRHVNRVTEALFQICEAIYQHLDYENPPNNYLNTIQAISEFIKSEYNAFINMTDEHGCTSQVWDVSH